MLSMNMFTFAWPLNFSYSNADVLMIEFLLPQVKRGEL